MNTLDTFIKNWEESAVEYYLDLKAQRKAIFDHRWELMEKYGFQSYDRNTILPEDYKAAKEAERSFDFKLTKQSLHIIRHDEKRMKALITKEAETKKKNLINRIEKKAGKFVDCGELFIGFDGNINGYIEGDLKRVNVSTIYAGGHNIQCLHYRILVK